MTELFAILVLRYNLSPAYVLDHMQLYEAKALINKSSSNSKIKNMLRSVFKIGIGLFCRQKAFYPKQRARIRN